MAILGNHFLDGKYDFIGGCTSVSSFITALLRLCGFSTKNVFNVNIGGKSIVILNQPPFFAPFGGGGHMVNLVNADGKWFVVDATGGINKTGGRLFTEHEKYQISKIYFLKDFDLPNVTAINRFFVKDRVSLFENDEYFLGESWQGELKIYSNMDKTGFRRIFNSAFTIRK